MDRTNPPDEDLAGSASQGASEQGDMGVLGNPSPTLREPMQPEAPTLRQLQYFRPSQVTNLLNSTQLGKVISERQWQRHRRWAGRFVNRGRRVDLVGYAAWLVQLRHLASATTVPTDIRLPGLREYLAAVRRRNSQNITPQAIRELIECQGHRCALTGRKLRPETASLDHIIPISRGGSHCIANAQVLHKDVNRAKGTLTNDEFVTLCRQVARYVGEMRHNCRAARRRRSAVVSHQPSPRQRTLFGA
jgi:5-methylcytosine-specific restriction endonuclease McrA